LLERRRHDYSRANIARVAVGTGFSTVDAALGDLITGDNVVWMCDDTAVYRTLATRFVRDATGPDERCVLVDFGQRSVDRRSGVDRLAATAASPFGNPVVLADELERRVRGRRPACLVVDPLTRGSRRWSPDVALGFFARVCPAMLDLGVTAYWCIDASYGRAFVDGVRQVTQCLVDTREGRLRVLKAEGRPDALLGLSYQLRLEGDEVIAEPGPAGGRLARGLVALRAQLGLTQQELAAAGGVTSSAISQAEAGSRGLSLDTVIRIADRLEVSVDRLIGTGTTRSHRLARHDRSRRIADGQIVALAPDSAVGTRAYLVELDGGQRVEAPFAHRGVATVAPLRGLVQVELDDDRPVLRAGDVLVVEAGSVRAWRNLRPEPTSCYWLLRD
jgi:transcriptional regulator with XRE-family HTH domain